MTRFPMASSRTVLLVVGVAAAVIVLGLTSATGWLSYSGYLALTLAGPLALLLIVLVGVWSGVKYVKDRSWQD